MAYAIAEITRELERDGKISDLIATEYNFEMWWQREILLAFSRDPYYRAIGSKDFDDRETGATIEQAWEPTDRRLKFCRRYGRNHKRIDLVLRRGPVGSMFHLIELKVVGPQTTNVAALERDLHGLEAVQWDNVCSAWLVVLVHGFETRDRVLERLRLWDDATDDVRVYPIASHNPEHRLWVVGHRVA